MANMYYILIFEKLIFFSHFQRASMILLIFQIWIWLKVWKMSQIIERLLKILGIFFLYQNVHLFLYHKIDEGKCLVPKTLTPQLFIMWLIHLEYPVQRIVNNNGTFIFEFQMGYLNYLQVLKLIQVINVNYWPKARFSGQKCWSACSQILPGQFAHDCCTA